MKDEKEVDERTQRLLKTILEHFDKEDRVVRERQIRTWRRLKLFWEGFHRAWYSEVAHDWRIWDESVSEDSNTDQGYYDKPINVFRAYLESIIAALSVTVPPIKCFPDDADNTLDIATAKAGDKIAELLFRHNDVPLLWLHALFIYCTEGLVACYTYPESKEEYGTYEKKEYKDSQESSEVVKCPSCGYNLEERPVNPEKAAQKEGEFQPEEIYAEEPTPQEAMSYAETGYGGELCPGCGEFVTPDVSNETFTVTRFVGSTKEPKTRICMEAFGGLYVKVPSYTRSQKDCLYLIYNYETHYANAIERYFNLHGKLTKEKAQKVKANQGGYDAYEQWGRLSPQYNGEYPENNVTVRNAWFRCAAYNILDDTDDIEYLKKEYPKGVKVVFVNDEFADACPEAMDDCWTLTYNPMSDYIHHDPLGLLLVSVQEITNDLISLILQTIEHGIGQAFADPAVLSFPAYRNTETVPGGIYEATPKSGKSLSDAFHEIKTATLSPEVMPFATNIQNLAQLVSGALPSLFGGAIEGSETASQYSMSRAQALQRLQNVWKMLTIWWKNIFGKAIPAYIKEVKEDERMVQRNDDGSFVNVFIRKADLEGKIGQVELEANENLPITWSQKKDVIMQLLQAANPQIMAVLGNPENLPQIRDAIGLTDFFVPGEDDRNKQYDEIKILLQTGPMPSGDPMNPEVPTVEVDPVYDDHETEFEIVRKWVVSEAGRLAKTDNPDGYKNVLLHGYQHYQLMGQAGAMAAANGEGAAPSEKPDTTETKDAPIEGEADVAATV